MDIPQFLIVSILFAPLRRNSCDGLSTGENGVSGLEPGEVDVRNERLLGMIRVFVFMSFITITELEDSCWKPDSLDELSLSIWWIDCWAAMTGWCEWDVWWATKTWQAAVGNYWRFSATFCAIFFCFFFTNSIWTISALVSMRIQLNILTSTQLVVSTPPGSTKSKKISVKIVKTLNISNSADIYTMKINPNRTCTIARASSSAVGCVQQLLSLVSSQGYAVINLKKKKVSH